MTARLDRCRAVVFAALVGLAPTVLSAQENEPTAVDPVARSNELRKAAYAAELDTEHGKAADAFLELTKLEPNNPEWFTKAADNLGKSGRFNDALDLLDGVYTRFQDVPDLILMLARTYHLKADTMVAEGVRDANVQFYYADAARTAQRVLEKNPKHLEARLLVASARYQVGAYDEALTEAQQAATDHPNAYGAHAMIGRILFQRFVEGQQRKASEKPRGRARSELDQAIYRDRTGAETAFVAAAAADENRAFPHQKLGDLDAWMGQLPAARSHYATALGIDPRVRIDHGWLESSYQPKQLVELYSSAATAYRKRTDAKPANAAILDWYTARAHFGANELEVAAKLFASTLKDLPDYHDTYYYLVQCAYWAGDLDGAAKHAVGYAQVNARRFADQIRSDDQNKKIVEGLAGRLFKADDVAGSRDLNLVLAFAANTVDAWNNYAFLCRETRRYEDSYSAYERALELAPDEPQLLNDAAVILQYHLQNEENLARAKDYYQRAVAAAEKLLAKGGLEDDEKARVRTALRDAKNNLKKFGRRR